MRHGGLGPIKLLFATLISAVAFPAHAAMVFVLNDTNPGGSDPLALAAFQRAADRYSTMFTDSITVRIDVSFGTLSPGVLGTTSFTQGVATYNSVRSALALDATTADDAQAVANLTAGSTIAFRTNALDGSVTFDNDGSANNTYLALSQANLKALNLVTDNGSSDGSIQFSDAFSFDFDSSDGIDASSYDFEGVAAHEIGHLLGIFSGVDSVDATSGSGPFAPLDINGYAIFNTLDLYRYSADSLSLGTGILDLATGGTSFISIDGGSTNLGLFSTGISNGDGRQASHWKDNLGLGMFDPTASTGELLTFSSLDLLGLDVIGYDFDNSRDPVGVPEPGSMVLLALCGSGFAIRRRRLSRGPSPKQPVTLEAGL